MTRPLRRLSLRARLALAHAAAAAAVLSVAGVSAALWLQSRLTAQVDRDLATDLATVQQVVGLDDDGDVVANADGDAGPQGDSTRLFVVRDPEGRVRLASSPRAATLLAHADPVPSSDAHAVTLESRRLRIVSTQIGTGPRTLALIAARDLALVDSTMAEVRRLLLLGVPLATLITLAGSYFGARAVLSVVDAMTSEARRIATDRLDRRLPVVNPRDELGRLALTLNEALGRIERSVESARRFTADAAHELRTPVAAVRALGEVALGGERDAATYRATIEDMLDELRRLADLVDRLLMLARADAEQLPVERLPVALDQVARHVVELFRPLADERGIAMRSAVEAGCTLDGDGTLLESALSNLVDNALNATGRGGTVFVAVSRVDGGLEVAVLDSGRGIAPDQLPHVFERFFRGSDRRACGGAGLGLALTRWIAEVHGGSIRCSSVVGRGTCFALRFE